MKELRFTHNGATLPTQIGTKITKDQLYGEVRRFVEKDGRRLERGYLLPDGHLIRRSQLSLAAVDPEGTTVEAPSVLRDGQPAEPEASSFDRESELTEAPLTRLVGFNAGDVYQLQALDLPAGLYETTFNYRKSYEPRQALVLVKSPGLAFLLVGTFKNTTFVGQSPAYEFFDVPEEDADEADPLDFAMM